jgi:xylose isomerase
LQFLRNQGFETFDNLWPESYDTVQQDRQRADTVFELVRDIVKIYNKNYTGWDRETTQRLEHNHNRFFDIDLITQKFHNEIIGDIQEFLSRT